MRRSLFLSLLLMAGCAGTDHLAQFYPGPPVARFHFRSQAFAVWHHAKKAAFVTQLGAGEAATAGFVRGLTLGAVRIMPPQITHVSAAEALLAAIGGAPCRVVRSNIVHDTTVEHDYLCDDGRVLTPAALGAAGETLREERVTPDKTSGR